MQNDKVCNLYVTSERWKDRNSERQERLNIIVIFSQPLIKIAEQYLKKASRLEGLLETRKWQDQNGQDKYSTEVVLRPYKGELNMLDSRAEGGAGGFAPAGQSYGGGAPAASQAAPAPVDDMEDEIPF